MTDAASLTTLLDDVYERVCSRLAQGGHTSINLRREWFEAVSYDAQQPDLIAKVPVGRDLFLRIVACRRGDSDIQALADRFAAELPAALVNVEAAKWGLRRYAANVRRAAMSAVEESRRAGLDLSFAGVTFKRTRAFHLGHSDWREAADHILAEVLIVGLDDDLRPTLHELIVEEAEDVAGEIEALHDEQQERQIARDALHRNGANVSVDEVTFRHLAR